MIGSPERRAGVAGTAGELVNRNEKVQKAAGVQFPAPHDINL